jgi:hypothetical protein
MGLARAGLAIVAAAICMALGSSPAVARADAHHGHAHPRWLNTSGSPARLGFDDQGDVVAIRTADRRAVELAHPGGLLLRDPTSGREYAVNGALHRHGRSLTYEAVQSDLGARVMVTYRAGDAGTVDVSGAVEDLTGRDRVLDTEFTLPLALIDGTWQRGLITSDPIAPGADLAPQTALPLAVVAGADRKTAIGLAIDPRHPSRFVMSVDAGSDASTFTLRQLWGLSPDASGALQGRAPFHFTVDLGVDPRWGMRSALARYYARDRDMFRNRAGEAGAWQVLPRSRYSEPSFLAFHEAGRAKGDAQTVSQYAANDEWAADDAAGVRTLPYTIAGQAEITDLPTLPANYDQAMQALDSWQHAPVPFGANNSPNSYRSSDADEQVIRNSGVFSADGRYTLSRRRTGWGGNSVTFPTDPNPRLSAPDGGPTMGSYLLGTYVPEMLSSPFVDGIYVDSLWGWGRYYDYRRAHFGAAEIPLTYADVTNAYGTKQVAGLSNDFSVLEFLWALRDRLHARGKILMTNGVRIFRNETRAFDAFASDVFGAEVKFSALLDEEDNLAFYREVADQKPVLSLIYDGWENESDVAALWKRALLYGFAPASAAATLDAFTAPGPLGRTSGMPANEVAYQRRYMPVLRRLANAGWRPVTGVQAGSGSVRIERYGQRRDDFYLVILDTGGKQGVAFRPDRDVARVIRRGRVMDVLSGQPATADLTAALAGDGTVTLGPDQLEVVHVTR